MSYARYSGFGGAGGGGGVSSLNSLTGAVVLAAGSGISLSTVGNTITVSSTGGTVTSVAATVPSFLSVSGSPITTSGTLAFSLTTQSANTVFAGPTSGAPATPTFRALTAADLPSLSYVSSVTASAPLISSGGLTPNLTITQAGTSTNGYLSSADWNTFNSKQPAGSYEVTTNKGVANGYAALDSSALVPLSEINPSLIAPTYAEFHVLASYSGTSTGSYNQPYTSIQAAVNAAQASSLANCVVFLHSNTTENITINNYGGNLLIESFGATTIDSQIYVISGNITISGLSTRIKLKDLKIVYPGGTQPDLIDSSSGRNYFGNIDCGGGGGIQFTGSWSHWHEFTECTINGNINISGSPAAGSQVSFWRLRGAPTITLNSSNVSLLLVDIESIGTITQTNGSILMNGGLGFVAGSSIISTANSPDTLVISDVSLQISGTTFAPITKSGTAPYALSGVWRNESIDTLTGSRIVYGATSADQTYVPATPANWSPVPADVKDALDTLAAAVASGPTGTVNAYSAVSTEGQTVINFGFNVKTTSTSDVNAFLLTVDGKLLTVGSSNDYTFTSISGGLSSQATLNLPLTAGLNIQAIKFSTVALSGSAQNPRAVASVSIPTTALAASNTDYVYFVSGTTTITLPTAVANTNLYTIKNTGSNTVTIATTSSQTIDGSSTASLPVANTSLDLISDGTNWRLV